VEKDIETAFEALLDELDFPKIFPEVRAAAMRCIWKGMDGPPKSLARDLYGQELHRCASVGDQERFYDLFDKLWKSLLKHRTEGVPFHFTVLPPPQSVRDIQSRVYIRNLEIEALNPLLREERLPPQHVLEFQNLAERAREEADILARVVRETGLRSEKVSLGSWENLLNAIEGGLEDAYNRLGWMYGRMRRDANEGPSEMEKVETQGETRSGLE
jgi:hypothetical protein